jgi:2-methylcitrate dehydratase PrpD
MSTSAIAERHAEGALAVSAAGLPEALRAMARNLVVDIVGLCLAARGEDYMRAAATGIDPGGACTVFGHAGGFDPQSAILLNGTAAHGEDFDDTFEGGPVHCGAVIVPTLLAAAERHDLSGEDVLAGLAIGCELMCRLGLVAPRAVHKAGFHPTAIFGAIGAAAAVATALRLPKPAFVSALGIAGSTASGVIEYLAEGAWTKRMHPGWAGQGGYRAALMAQGGFLGPRTVFEGKHGLFHGFARTTSGDWEALTGDFGARWISATIAFKPYPCGTMAHPYIDCALRLRAAGIEPDHIAAIVCETAEGFVHRLWEPLAAKQAPPNGYAAKFSIPYAVAAALVRGEVGLADFSDAAVRDEAVLRLARKISYVVDPDHPYPRQYTGHLKATLADGGIIEERQPHLRGGAAEPLTDAEIAAKFRANAAYDGWSAARSEAALTELRGLFAARKIDLTSFREIP